MHGPDEGALLVTAEHAGHRVPAAYRHLFAGHELLLDSHRGWDPGTSPLARQLARTLGGDLRVSRVTRLLVDLNRSPHNPRVFSEVTRCLPPSGRELLLERYHRPYREAVQTLVGQRVDAGRQVLHLSVHSFTETLNGSSRPQDLALLYDPTRVREADLAARWTRALTRVRPDLRLRRNHPYLGKADGLTTTLRARLSPEDYVGIEVEVSQRHLSGRGRFPPWIPRLLAETLLEVLPLAPPSSGQPQRRPRTHA